MANQLTHALLAAGTMALFNPFMRTEPVSWNIFLAAFAGMLMSLDESQCRIFRGSPLCNSLGCGILMAYLAFMLAYLGHAFFGWELMLAMTVSLAIAVGILAHLAAEFFTGQVVLTFPRNMDITRWLKKIDEKSERFWSSWGRAGLKSRGLRDSQLNGISLAVLLLTIWVF